MNQPETPKWVRWAAIAVFGSLACYSLVIPGIEAMISRRFYGGRGFALDAPDHTLFGWDAFRSGAGLALVGLLFIAAMVFVERWLHSDDY